MVQHPISLMNQGALYWCFQLMYHLFQNSFGKVIKTLKIEQAGEYIWRTLYFIREASVLDFGGRKKYELLVKSLQIFFVYVKNIQ